MSSNQQMLTRVLALLLSVALLTAQEQTTAGTIGRVTVNNVIAPTIVVDKSGNYVNGLTVQDFVVYDNDKPQDFKVDVAFQPIDLAVVIQADAVTDQMLPKIKKLGPLLENLIIGEQGAVSITAFDHRIRELQEFTNDSAKIKKALESINPGSSSARQIDAMNTAIRSLSHRGKDRRRILLLISETRDKGSEGRLKDALLLAEINNVIVYTINMSRFLNTLTAKAPPPRPNPIPPSAIHTPAGGTATPTTVMQNSGYGASVLPAFVEIFRQAKAVFVPNPAEVFTKYTGGREFGFVSQRALEDAVGRIGEELHSHYLISYNPNNKIEGGWHAIRVEVRRPNVEVRTRGGYWMAGVPE